MTSPQAGPRRPNQYHLHGRGLSVSYYPDGTGPPLQDKGRLRMVYQDAVQTLNFYDADIRVIDSSPDDVGTVVSVTTVRTVDTGSTTFSLLVPLVALPDDLNGPVSIETIGLTTIHRILASAIGHPQREVYTVTGLRGTASAGILPI